MVSLLVTVAFARAPRWVREEPLTASPRDLVAAAEAADARAGIAVLLDEQTHRVQEDGRVQHTTRLIWQLNDLAERESWSVTEASWAPWREDRPIIRARVITPSGEVLELDPSLMAENADRSAEGQVLSDRRLLRAPLPRLDKGSIVEEQVIWTESRPYLGGGGYGAYGLSPRHEGTLHFVRELAAHEDRPFRWEVTDEGVEARVSKDGDFRVVTVHLEEPEQQDYVDYVPDRVWGVPVLHGTSIAAWADIGRNYAEISDTQQNPAGLEDVIAEIEALPEDERVAAAYRFARDLRYTSIAFGEHAIKPVTPMEVLDRGFGDCKDKANLLVTLLGAVGVPAKLALVRAGHDRDVDADFPSSGRFNHAIVHLPEADRWLDPTASTVPASEVPLSVQGRQALVVDGAQSQLLEVPWPKAEEAVYEQERIFDLRGDVTVVETRRAVGGWIADMRRDTWRGLDAPGDDRAESWFENLTGTELESFEITGVDDYAAPVQVKATGVYGPRERTAYAYGDAVFVDLEQALRDALSVVEERDLEPLEGRTLDVRNVPHTGRSTVRVVLPEDFEYRDLPEPVDIDAGGIRFTREVEARGDGFTIADTYVASAEVVPVPALREVVEAMKDVESELEVEVAPRGLYQYQAGDRIGGLATARAGTSAESALLEASLLQDLGYNDIAVDVIREAAEANPENSTVLGLLGIAKMSDPVGRLLRPPFDLEGAIADLERAVQQGNDAPALRRNLAALYWTRAIRSPEPRADLERSLAESEAYEEVQDRPAPLGPSILVALDRCEEAADRLKDDSEAEYSTHLEVLACDRGPKAAMQWLRGELDDPDDRSLVFAEGLATLRMRDDDLWAKVSQAYGDDYPHGPRAEQIADRILSGYQVPRRHEPFVERYVELMRAVIDQGTWPDQGIHPSLRTRTDVLDQLRRAVPNARVSEANAEAWAREVRVLSDLEVEGGKKEGWRVHMSNPSGSFWLGFVRADDGELLVRMIGPSPREAGLHALDLLEQDEMDAAITWLRWARPGLANLNPLARMILQKVVDGDLTEDEANAVASAFVVSEPARFEEVERLVQGIRPLGESELAQDLWKLVPLGALSAIERNGDAEPLLEEAREVSDTPFGAFVRALHAARRGEDVSAYVEGMPPAQRPGFLAMGGQIDAFLEATKGQEVPPQIWNQAIWQLASDGRSAEALPLAHRHLRNASTPALLHTYAVVAAMEGDLTTAASAKAKAVELEGGVDRLQAVWGLVDGFVLDRLGYPERARAAFDRVRPELGFQRVRETMIPERYR